MKSFHMFPRAPGVRLRAQAVSRAVFGAGKQEALSCLLVFCLIFLLSDSIIMVPLMKSPSSLAFHLVILQIKSQSIALLSGRMRGIHTKRKKRNTGVYDFK